MAEKDFAIVCDATCDLPRVFLDKARVLSVRLDGPDRGELDAQRELELLYRECAAGGFERVISVHSAASFSPVVEAARSAAAACADVADVRVVSSGSLSTATGMLIDRAARYRHLGVGFEDAVAALGELAAHVRLLAIPSASTLIAARRSRRTRVGLIGRATATLRMRMTGERGLYLLSDDRATQLARNNDTDALAHRLAHAVTAVSAGEGQLVHAFVSPKGSHVMRALERALTEEDADSSCLGTVRPSALTEGILGPGFVAMAIAPRSAYWRDEAALVGLGSQSGAPARSEGQNRRIT